METANAPAGRAPDVASTFLLEDDFLPRPRRRRIWLPALLLLATCVSTFWTGSVHWDPISRLDGVERAVQAMLQPGDGSAWAAMARAGAVLRADWQQGFVYMAAVLGILLMHELGHFVVALRHRIPASLPFFIPVPVLPFGTMGAVIGMQGSKADRRQMFDLGVTGPLAGLLVAIPVIFIGIEQLAAVPQPGAGFCFHNPLLVRLMIETLRPDYPTPELFYLNQFSPLLMAGWVGLLVTGLNMLPISQLDGGHVAYAVLGRRAHVLARGLVVAAILFILATEQYGWVLMLVVVILLGTDHPPTADDRAELSWTRRLLGWAALMIPILCFPPMGITE